MEWLNERRQRWDDLIIRWVLPFGFFVFLTANFYVDNRSAYKTVVYLTVLLPAFIVFLLNTSAQRQIFRQVKGLWPLFIMMAYFALSSLWATESNQVNYFKRGVFILLFVVAVIRLKPPKVDILALMDAAAALVAVMTIWQMWRFYGLEGNDFGIRIVGYNGLINELLSGYFVGVFVCYSLLRAFSFSNQPKKVLIFVVIALPALVFVWFTQSRTPLIWSRGNTSGAGLLLSGTQTGRDHCGGITANYPGGSFWHGPVFHPWL